jgi:probable rRNA maturation factor
MSLSLDSEIIFESEETVDGMEDQFRLRQWIKEIVQKENRQIERIAYFFISDDALLKMNKEFLNHDELTDILTFPYTYHPISADIYISYDRVSDNAALHDCHVDEELRRVIIHGVLHMCGWSDTTEEENMAMRRREDECLSLWK